MRFELRPEDVAVRDELRTYFGRLAAEEDLGAVVHERRRGPTHRRVVERMGRDGYLGLGWPPELGGRGLGPVAQWLFLEEAKRVGAPIPHLSLFTVAPTLLRFGTDEQRDRYLPPILAGEIEFAAGYSEPDAGTDLASLRTRAVRHDDHYRVDGSKVFTTGGDVADYVWLAVRTDPLAERHRGISILIVDVDQPGFSWTPIRTLSGVTTTATYYDDVRVPLTDRVGDEGRGWTYLTDQLNHERLLLASDIVPVRRLYDAVLDAARSSAVTDRLWVRAALARSFAALEAVRLVTWQLVGALEQGTPAAGAASTAKVVGTEQALDVIALLTDVVDALPVHQDRARLRAEAERLRHLAIVNTFGGGANEVQRQLVATTTLGLPRSRR